MNKNKNKTTEYVKVDAGIITSNSVTLKRDFASCGGFAVKSVQSEQIANCYRTITPFGYAYVRS